MHMFSEDVFLDMYISANICITVRLRLHDNVYNASQTNYT